LYDDLINSDQNPHRPSNAVFCAGQTLPGDLIDNKSFAQGMASFIKADTVQSKKVANCARISLE